MKKITDKIADAWGVGTDIISDAARITISGDREIYIEHHRGVREYGSDVIGVMTGKGVIRIYGKSLKIAAIRQEDILVEGSFTKIEYEAKNVK